MLTSNRNTESANILVVDDNRDAADTLALLLTFYGHSVQIAFDGHQAIEIARRQRPNYVLLDLGMPGVDGYQVAAWLRHELAGPVVIIAITGYGREVDRRRALAAGFDHFFLKPIDHGALIALLSKSNTEPSSPSLGHEGRPLLTVSRQVQITNILGFHLRAADKFVRLAQQFRADVRIACDGRKVSGRSILDLATLAAECGCQLELEAAGPDAEAAVAALANLIGQGFDEQDH
jgi:phosphotransferase system HPr (HPr) family protein